MHFSTVTICFSALNSRIGQQNDWGEGAMKLNLHAKMEIAVVAILLLASCGDNARNAISRINDLESRVEELELKLDN